MHITKNRTTKVHTLYGLARPINPKCGIEQGECNAPLLWNIFYNPLLCKLSQSIHAYYIHRSPTFPVDILPANPDLIQEAQITKTHDFLPVPENLLINNVAFMDDLVLLTKRTEGLKELLTETESFLDLHGISLNTLKTILSRRIPEGENMSIKQSPIGQFIEDGSSFRYLGVQISLQGRHSDQILDLHKSVLAEFTGILSSKSITDKIASYHYKMVLVPKIAFKASGLSITMTEADSL